MPLWPSGRLLAVLVASAMAAGAAGPARAAIGSGVQAPLIDAVRDDVLGDVRALLRARADPNARDEYGATALSWAVIRVNAALVKELLKAGADPNLADVNGVTPLALAAGAQAKEIVDLLLSKGANPNLARASGETPLMAAIRVGDADIVKMLLAHGAEVNVRESKFDQTALMWAAGHPEIVRQLLARGADVRTVTKSWDVTATIYTPITFTLGVTGIPWNNEGDYTAKAGGLTPLHFAVQEHDLESAKLLLDAGADVNYPSADGTTPLLASLYGWRAPQGRNLKFAPSLAMANLLLDRGARVEGVDRAGYTPLHGAALALVMARPEGAQALSFFPNKRPSPTPVRPTAAKDEAEVLDLAERLLKGGADPDRPTLFPTGGPVGAVRINPAPPGSTPFHIAAAAHSPRLVALMRKYGADPNLARKDGHTPFSVAVMSNDLPVVQALIAGGADLMRRYDLSDKISDPVLPKTEERKQQTILHVAAISGSDWVIEELAARGAPVNAKNDHGETPLDLALAQEQFRRAYDKEQKFFDGVALDEIKDTFTSDAVRRAVGRATRSAEAGVKSGPGG